MAKSHQPFHWLVEFYGIMSRRGFDVIIGNPPYVVNTPEKVAYDIRADLFTTHSSKNLYAFVYERSLNLAHTMSSLGLIVQHGAEEGTRTPEFRQLFPSQENSDIY